MPVLWQEAAGGWLAILLESAVKGSLLLGSALIFVSFGRRLAPGFRSAILMACFCGLLLLPAFPAMFPSKLYRLPLLPSQEAITQTIGQPESNPNLQPVSATLNSMAPPARGPRMESVARPIPPRFRGDWRIIAFIVWAVGCAAVLIRLMAGFIAVRRLVRDAKQIPERFRLEADRLAQKLGMWQAVGLRLCRGLEVPIACGLIHPLILLPDAAAIWPAERCAAVLTHELAHIRRRDILQSLAARAAAAVFFFNPLIWLAIKEFHEAREEACDCLVLGEGIKASDYAAHLLALARPVHFWPGEYPGAAGSGKSKLERRITRIMNASSHPAVRKHYITATAIFVLSGFVLLGDISLTAAASESPVPLNPAISLAGDQPADAVQAANFGTDSRQPETAIEQNARSNTETAGKTKVNYALAANTFNRPLIHGMAFRSFIELKDAEGHVTGIELKYPFWNAGGDGTVDFNVLSINEQQRALSTYEKILPAITHPIKRQTGYLLCATIQPVERSNRFDSLCLGIGPSYPSYIGGSSIALWIAGLKPGSGIKVVALTMTELKQELVPIRVDGEEAAMVGMVTGQGAIKAIIKWGEFTYIGVAGDYLGDTGYLIESILQTRTTLRSGAERIVLPLPGGLVDPDRYQ